MIARQPQEVFMARQTFEAPQNQAVTVVVFEPPQTEGQAEVEIDRFPLDAGQKAERDYESATAAYRFENRIVDREPVNRRNLTLEERRERMMEEDQERLDKVNSSAPERRSAEMDRGSEVQSRRQQELEEAERTRDELRDEQEREAQERERAVRGEGTDDGERDAREERTSETGRTAAKSASKTASKTDNKSKNRR
jgi:hypothetical protein